MEEILINNAVHETRVALLEDNVLQELRIERNSATSLVGNIYLGVVAKVLPGMQSAFVEIGLSRAAFLHVGDMRQAHQEDGTLLPIERILHDGQIILVQVSKDQIGTKGARLTTEISLAGRLLVYLPYDSHIGVSQRIEDEAERERLKEAIEILSQTEGPHTGGFIVRTSGEDSQQDDFINDMKYLEKQWKVIVEKTRLRLFFLAMFPFPKKCSGIWLVKKPARSMWIVLKYLKTFKNSLPSLFLRRNLCLPCTKTNVPCLISSG